MKDYFKGIAGDQIFSANITIEDKIHDIIPKYISDDFRTFNIDDTSKEMILKRKFNEMGMFCFVSWNWLNPLSKWIGNRKCLEVMAGRGWLSYGLQENGIDIIATDDFSWHNKENFKTWNNTVTDVEELDAIKAVEKYGKDIDILIIAWPYMDDTAYHVIKKLHEENPDAVVIYCGEGPEGCTASDSFFKSFEKIEDDVFYEEVAGKYQTWCGLYDHLRLGRYKKQ